MPKLLVKLDHGTQNKSNSVPEDLGLLKLSTHFKSKGQDVIVKSCRDRISKDIYPSEICFSPVFGFRLKNDIKYIAAFSKKFPKAQISIGGVQATIRTEMFKKYIPSANVVTGIQPDFDEVSPDYDAFGKGFSFGFTSRGCKRKCAWCVVPITEGKMSNVDYWRNSLADGHKLFSCMDNNTLACGIDWVRDIFEEMKQRSMVVDFNQGMDCRIFAKDESYAELFREYKKQIRFLRFSWDSAAVDKISIKALELMAKYGLIRPGLDMWYVLYGNGETPDEFWRRIKKLSEYRQDIKPMLFKDLDTGKSADGWAKNFHKFLSITTAATGKITEGDFNKGLYGRSPDKFLKVIAIGSNAGKFKQIMGCQNFTGPNRQKLIEYING